MHDANSWLLVLGLAVASCGGATPPAEAPDSAAEDSSAAVTNTPSVSAEATAVEAPTTGDAGATEAHEPNAASEPEPAFTENMSVAEAEKAVPRGLERANLDQETLGKPLQNLEQYESCKPAGAKVKIKAAIWDGKAVGVDVTTTPKNDTLSQCIRAKVRELTWDKKVKSLNTVEFQL